MPARATEQGRPVRLGFVTPKRVLLIDDDPFTRVTLANTVTSLGYELVGDCESATIALKAAAEVHPDVAIVDLDLGEGPTGIDVARGLRRLDPNIGIVMLSTFAEPRLMGHNQPELPVNSIYLVKRSVTSPEVLGRALRLAISPDAHTGATDRALGFDTPLSTLSDQQVEIMRLIATGSSNADIARRRFINEASVEKAIARLIKQLDLKAGKDQNQRVMIAQLYFQLTGASGARQD